MLFLAVDVYGGGLLPKNGRPPPGRPLASSQGDAWEMEKRRGSGQEQITEKAAWRKRCGPMGSSTKAWLRKKK